MSDVLQHQHQPCATAYDIMYSLNEMFGDKDRATRQVAIKELFNTKMADSTPVRDHVLKIMGHLNELQVFELKLMGRPRSISFSSP